MVPACAYLQAMLGSDYKGQDCSAARALEIVGERWSLLILRDAIFRGTTQFGGFQKTLGVATNILAKRLERFVAEGLMTGPDDGHYRLTPKGRDFAHALVVLTDWGDRWACPGPVDFVEANSGEAVAPRLVRVSDGAAVGSDAIAVKLRDRKAPKA